MSEKIRRTREKKYKIIFWGLLVFFLIATAKMHIVGCNDMSRYLAISSLVENGSFEIESKSDKSTDVVFYQGKYYSSKPPLLSVIGAGIYWPVNKIFGYKMKLEDKVKDFSVYLINLIITGGSVILLLFFFSKSLILFEFSEKRALILSALLFLGTLIFSYYGVLNNHLPSAALIFAGFYFFLRQVREGVSHKKMLLTGFIFSLAFGIEPIFSGILIFFLTLYLLFNKKLRKNLPYFITGMIPVLFFYALYNLFTINSLLPTYFNKNLYNYPGSYWLNPGGYDSLNHPKILYLCNLLLGTHGLFLYTPILFFSIYGFKKIIANKAGKIRNLTIFILVSIIFYIFFIVFFTNNYGGYAYGARWFICFTPLLFFYLAICYKDIIRKYFLLFNILLALSIIFSIFGFINPWEEVIFSSPGRVFYFPLLKKISIPLLKKISIWVELLF